MSTGLYSWSLTASSNANADSAINWAEGQAPSSVNDSARAMMAVLAKYRDDISGAITTGGTSTAYTVTSNSVFDSLAHMANQMIAFVPHTTNGATVTLNVDGLGAKPLRAAPSVELQTGSLIQGTPYCAMYNNSDAVFYLHASTGTNSYSIPLGSGLPYFGSSAPNSAFAFPYGQGISRTTYATLFSLISTTFGSGDGSTTFNLPDLRGRVIAGLDNMGGSSAGRLSSVISSTTMGAVGGAQTQSVAQANLPNVNWSVTDTHRHGSLAGDLGYAAVKTWDGTTAAAQTGSGAVFNYPDTGHFITYNYNVSNLNTGLTSTGSITVNSGGSGAALTTTQPTMVANFIMRII